LLREQEAAGSNPVIPIKTHLSVISSLSKRDIATAHTVSEKGRLRELLLVEGAT